MRVSSHSASLSLLLFTAPLIAATQRTDSAEITVRGTLISPEQARERAVNFVRQTGVANGQQQVARWVVPACIKVIGLTAPQEAKVAGVMRGVAREAKVPVAPVDCEPNLTVSFTSDAGQLVRHIHARKPSQFSDLTRAEKEQLLNGPAAVRWWYVTEMMDRDGVKANTISAPWIGPDKEGGTSAYSLPTAEGVTATQQYNSGSNVRTPTVRSLYGANVVVDASTAEGTSVDAIAAYAAMVAFAEIKASDPPLDSILGLFQPGGAETTMTDWDMAFLKSLYRMPLDRRSRIQRGHLVEALLDERLPQGSGKQP